MIHSKSARIAIAAVMLALSLPVSAHRHANEGYSDYERDQSRRERTQEHEDRMNEAADNMRERTDRILGQ